MCIDTNESQLYEGFFIINKKNTCNILKRDSVSPWRTFIHFISIGKYANQGMKSYILFTWPFWLLPHKYLQLNEWISHTRKYIMYHHLICICEFCIFTYGCDIQLGLHLEIKKGLSKSKISVYGQLSENRNHDFFL